jgi:hypothetical protein
VPEENARPIFDHEFRVKRRKDHATFGVEESTVNPSVSHVREGSVILVANLVLGSPKLSPSALIMDDCRVIQREAD